MVDKCFSVVRVSLIGLAFLLLWIRFVWAASDLPTDPLGQAITGVFTFWVLTHLIAFESMWLMAARWAALAITNAIVNVIAAVDTTLHFDSVVSHTPSFVLDYAIVVNITALGTLELFIKWQTVERTSTTIKLLENDEEEEDEHNV